jgi:choline dehydrogenase-like flavoprotein
MSVGSADDDLLDSSLRLKACDNVFVCDGSVIQEHSYANTGLTIGQLALRLSDTLSRRATV